MHLLALKVFPDILAINFNENILSFLTLRLKPRSHCPALMCGNAPWTSCTRTRRYANYIVCFQKL